MRIRTWTRFEAIHGLSACSPPQRCGWDWHRLQPNRARRVDHGPLLGRQGVTDGRRRAARLEDGAKVATARTALPRSGERSVLSSLQAPDYLKAQPSARRFMRQ